MIQKLVIFLLGLAMVAVVGVGLVDASRSTERSSVESALLGTTPTPNRVSGQGKTNSNPTGTPAANPSGTNLVAQDGIGTLWQATGTITKLDDFGFDLLTETGSVYVELGPPTYWKAQNIVLAVGDTVTVNGFFNGQQTHARLVTIGSVQLTLRTESGQPMWSGGAENVKSDGGAQGGGSTGSGTPQPQIQVAPEDWITLKGVLASVVNGNVTLNTTDNNTVMLQMGQPQFWQSQGVTLAAGDTVEVLGFWSNGQFMVGDILKVETGEHIILRDPNGRQLWGGPGRNSSSNGSGGSAGGGNGNGRGGGNGNGNGKNNSRTQTP
ncbi:hypothetical protein ANRL4_05503 [Anaerolineae bacterium]|nr:hypothetical protein ANRL4_05503 [Anaerolineae bacterium]